jgi:hypothetical protein
MQEAAGAFAWLESSGVGRMMRSSLWMYPIVEIFHIVGFAILVGSVAMFDLRVLGFSRSVSVTSMARHLLRWSWLSLLLVVPAGLMMFSAHPDDFVSSRVFQVKLALIAVAGLNAALFHTGVYRSVRTWDSGASSPGLARVHAALSLLLWIAVICCGRLLAYT